MPSISVIVPTLGRRPIRFLLKSLNRQSYSNFEIIVVANGRPSASFLESLSAASSKDVRLIRRANEGISAARNLGISEARGKVVAFTDDDCVADSGWVAAINERFSSNPERIMCGTVKLVFPQRAPSWIAAEFRSCLSEIDYGPMDRPLSRGEHVAGANLACGRRLLMELGGFDVRLGPSSVSHVELVNDDTDLVFRFEKITGERPFYLSQAKVDHHVTADRTVPEWFIRRRYRQGWSDTRMQQFRDPDEDPCSEMLARKVRAKRWRERRLETLSGMTGATRRAYSYLSIAAQTAYLRGLFDALQGHHHQDHFFMSSLFSDIRRRDVVHAESLFFGFIDSLPLEPITDLPARCTRGLQRIVKEFNSGPGSSG